MSGCFKFIGAAVVTMSLVIVAVVISVSITGDEEGSEPVVVMIVNEQGTPVSATVTPSPTPLPIEVTSSTLTRDYDSNEVAANQKYKGRLVLVTGKIGDISDSGYVSLRSEAVSGFLPGSVQCFFDAENYNQLAELQKDRIVTILGRLDGYNSILEIVKIENCVVVKK